MVVEQEYFWFLTSWEWFYGYPGRERRMRRSGWRRKRLRELREEGLLEDSKKSLPNWFKFRTRLKYVSFLIMILSYSFSYLFLILNQEKTYLSNRGAHFLFDVNSLGAIYDSLRIKISYVLKNSVSWIPIIKDWNFGWPPHPHFWS